MSAVIEAADVTRRYRSGTIDVDALRGVDFTVEAGELVAVMGPSGSGKSTLLGILGCLDRPTSGTYRLLGDDVGSLDEVQRARIRRERIGFVFQSFNLLPRSNALDNVALPLVYAGVRASRRHERALAALEQVGLGDRAQHRPSELSGGQQQRVAVARALVNDPGVVLADEPTGNLDSASAEEVLALLKQLNAQGTTIVLVTHEYEIAREARRIVSMRDGLVDSDEPVAA
jgi:putative ABC transport system ATP-binding protein